MVPADVVDEVWVIFHRDQRLSDAHVPDYDQIITACDRETCLTDNTQRQNRGEKVRVERRDMGELSSTHLQ